MKLMRCGAVGAERPAVVLPAGEIIDVSGFGEDFDERFFGTEGLSRLAQWLESDGRAAPKVPADVRLGPAVCRPSKLICIGLNYQDHAAESGAKLPSEPILFSKATSAWSGPNDAIVLPRGSSSTDWEVELAVVIGKPAKYVTEAAALGHVAGYALMNDVSERDFQIRRGGQWVKGKSADTFAPFGPVLVTPDEVADVQALDLSLELNGERMQAGNTRDMVFSVAQLISYVSGFMTLLPGDVISTGTPAGVGMGKNPPRYLRPGDRLHLSATGLGEQTALVSAPSE